jgi:hypothetical protein
MHLGGLGVLDLRLMGIALRIIWLWLQRAKPNHPWSSMTIVVKREPSSQRPLILFRGWQLIQVLDCPWMDQRQRMVAQGLLSNAWVHDIIGALTIPILIQYLELHQLLPHIQLVNHQPNRCNGAGTPQGSIPLLRLMQRCNLDRLRLQELGSSGRCGLQTPSSYLSG